jgi:hypothetical protein
LLTLSWVAFVSVLIFLLHLHQLAPLPPLCITVALVRSWNPDTALGFDLFASLALEIEMQNKSLFSMLIVLRKS